MCPVPRRLLGVSHDWQCLCGRLSRELLEPLCSEARAGLGCPGVEALMDPREVKDRILDNISLSVKKLQSYFAACEDETPAIRNHDRVLQRLCEHLDHALLYGLQDIASGYWVLVVHFTRREAVKQIEDQQHVATLLGRSRAWLYLALNENSLESYLRLFQENQSLLQKYYYKNALVCSHDHLTLFLTLVSGLEFIRFELEMNVPYLDLAPYMPEYYKPQHLLDFEDRLPHSVHGSDSLSLNSFNSINSANLEWDDSAIAPSSEDGEVHDGTSFPRPAALLHNGYKPHGKSPIQRHNPFTQDLSSSDVPSGPGTGADTPDTSEPNTQDSELDVTSLDTTLSYNQAPVTSDSTDISTQDIADGLSTSESTPVHSASHRNGSASSYTQYPENSSELEVIRLVKKKRTGKRRRGRSEDGTQHPGTLEPDDPVPEQEKVSASCHGATEEKPSDLPETGIRLPKMQDTSMEQVGQPLSELIDQLNDQLDPQAWNVHPEPTDQSFRTCSLGGTPGDPQGQNVSQGIQDPMDFYYFTPESPNATATGGGHNDSPGQGQSAHVPSGSEDVGQTQGGGEAETKGPLETHIEETLLTAPNRGKKSPALSIAEDSGVDEGQGSPSDSPHPCEFRVDNNLLLLLMIHVYRENEEQLFKMFRMSTGHMEGDVQLLYLLLTDCYIYLLRKGSADKPYTVEEAVSYNELDYISVGIDQQTVTFVCTNRRRQFMVDTADVTLTEVFLAALHSAMINGCREPPYPVVLTDATMEKLALAKFVSQESKRGALEVVTLYYGLVHWEDPLDDAAGPPSSHYTCRDQTVSKEGVLHYKANASYLGRETWKSCYVVLSNGILYQYPDRTDVIPMLSINMGGEQCGGCRRSNPTDRPHSFQVILTDRPSLELSADKEEDMADWMLHLCQAVSKGVIPQGGVPSQCLPCCLVLTQDKVIMCHQDCQTSFFRALGVAELLDVCALSTEHEKEYCVLEFTQDRSRFLPPWVLYFSCRQELERFGSVLRGAWKSMYQVELPHKPMQDNTLKKCEDARSLLHSAWQRSDSLCRGRSARDPWC
ncbi:pleckstrin homology domain-containing family M member 2 isoform X3 [Xenopus laevis]|uniref:Pleckstrin homology domain-containing family M member 2 n=1 Tax=Xenopus laevis TaxID=8355 RepID=A0A8J0TDJ7_XENLA|nr:pleckstrin homology domain-containing family M member 2 isoform X3 [Xenopus laevis]